MLREPLELHGRICHHLPRTTGDIDYYTAIPADLNLDELAGQGSLRHTKYEVISHSHSEIGC